MLKSLLLREPEVGVGGGGNATADSVMPPEPTWTLIVKPELQRLEARDVEDQDSGRFCKKSPESSVKVAVTNSCWEAESLEAACSLCGEFGLIRCRLWLCELLVSGAPPAW